MYYSVAAPILEQSNIDCEVVITKYQHHATEIAAKMGLASYDCIVAVGGDGLLSEGNPKSPAFSGLCFASDAMTQIY